jgi:hypothetical protein
MGDRGVSVAEDLAQGLGREDAVEPLEEEVGFGLLEILFHPSTPRSTAPTSPSPPRPNPAPRTRFWQAARWAFRLMECVCIAADTLSLAQGKDGRWRISWDTLAQAACKAVDGVEIDGN